MIRLNDHLPDLLTPVRDLHVAALLETLAAELNGGAEVDPEPVARDADGRILRRGPLDLPRRHDLRVAREGRVLMRRVPTAATVPFDVVQASLTDIARVSIGPFRWGEAVVRARQAAGKPNWTPLRLWFLECFQARYGEESPDLLGVVHGIEGPVEEPGGWRFAVDLGSGAPCCFAPMLAALAQSGCTDIVVGETMPAT